MSCRNSSITLPTTGKSFEIPLTILRSLCSLCLSFSLAASVAACAITFLSSSSPPFSSTNTLSRLFILSSLPSILIACETSVVVVFRPSLPPQSAPISCLRTSSILSKKSSICSRSDVQNSFELEPVGVKIFLLIESATSSSTRIWSRYSSFAAAHVVASSVFITLRNCFSFGNNSPSFSLDHISASSLSSRRVITVMFDIFFTLNVDKSSKMEKALSVDTASKSSDIFLSSLFTSSTNLSSSEWVLAKGSPPGPPSALGVSQ
mmetsp:Transcript_47728/g.123771  ORF Transcript_47728/g.123771 Transcript_47728/m.123771 type:complete len:263 (-) Transcript_47728:2307-3095(-)